jgi:hypothetical protein
MKTKALATLIIVVVLSVLSSAFTVQTSAAALPDNPGQECAQVLDRAAQIDLPSTRADYQILDRTAACSGVMIPATGPCEQILARAAQIDVPDRRADYQVLVQAEACSGGWIPVTGGMPAVKGIDPAYAEYKLRQVERMMGGE